MYPATCDINCDLGEGAANDALLMPFITSANIACGFHAGDEELMRATVQLARDHGVAIGAHPSLPDREFFGRREWACSASDVYNWVQEQLQLIYSISYEYSVQVHHVKPHGALYNITARDRNLAKAFCRSVADFDASLFLYGLSGSWLIKEGTKAGLRVANEVFADRTYQADGTLTPREQPNALITSNQDCIEQLLHMLRHGTVTTVTGQPIPITAETVCIHGDGLHALDFAHCIHLALKSNRIIPKSFQQ